MTWQTPKHGRKAQSLSAWLREQGFVTSVTDAVQKSKLATSNIGRLKKLRDIAQGEAGKLSKAQVRSVKPANVDLVKGKIVNLDINAAPGGVAVGDGCAGSGKTVTISAKEFAELKANAKTIRPRIEKLAAKKTCYGCG